MPSISARLILLCFPLLAGCSIADISQSSSVESDQSEQIATRLLDEVIQTQGFSVLAAQNLYTFEVTDHWPGFMGKLARLWPEPETDLLVQYNFNTFDGRACFRSGSREGDVIGVQSWAYYEQVAGDSLARNRDTGEEANSLEFGLVVLHYFLELPYRLRRAPIRRYYGERTLRGQTYDLVFATWKQEAPTPDFDQYILWINRETHLVDYCLYTLRDNKNPLTRQKYGSIAYLDYVDAGGFLRPSRMPVMLDDGIIKAKSLEDYFHQFTLHSFSYGGFDEATLYPLENLPKQIDTK
ncbi:MAG: hypothetical protein AAFV07_00150 [Bacteroidota bacterium]